MDIYHLWCNLKPGISDLEFVDVLQTFLGSLKKDGKIEGYRITRCKLGLRPEHLRDFHITIDTTDLAQLQLAFDRAASRGEPTESLHHAVNSKVEGLVAALYRDFPDGNRVTGQEKF